MASVCIPQGDPARVVCRMLSGLECRGGAWALWMCACVVCVSVWVGHAQRVIIWSAVSILDLCLRAAAPTCGWSKSACLGQEPFLDLKAAFILKAWQHLHIWLPGMKKARNPRWDSGFQNVPNVLSVKGIPGRLSAVCVPEWEPGALITLCKVRHAGWTAQC